MSFSFLALYTGDYLRDTRHLSPQRHGIYLLLLMHCWDTQGPVPLDEQEAAGIANCRSSDEIDGLRYILGRYFVRMEDGFYNQRMQREIERASNVSAARSEAGRLGYEARAKQLNSKRKASVKQLPGNSQATVSPPPPPPPLPPPQSTTTTPKVKTGGAGPRTSPTWDAYSDAYHRRYGVDPVRNAKINGQLSGLIDRVGAHEAPPLAAFYVSHNRQLYVASKHCVDLLVRDCEGLMTDFRRGEQTTETRAREADRIEETGAMWERLKAESSSGGRHE